MAWFVMLFMGFQSLTFYVTLAWLPTIFQEAGIPADQAGYLLSLSNLVQVGVALAVPPHAGKARSQVPHVTVATLLTAAGYAGVLLPPRPSRGSGCSSSASARAPRSRWPC
nr:hypothetical protein GCM10020093_054580 [Planobispora longispora]